MKLTTKKIVFLVDFLRTINAGTENQLSHLLRQLPELGYSVILISLQDSLFLENEAEFLFPDVTIFSLGAQSDMSKSLPSLFRLFKLLRNEKPDIVQTYFPTSNSIGIVLARMAGVKKTFSSRRDMGFNLTSIDIFQYRIANMFVTAVIANSNAVRKRAIQLEKIKPEKIHVIYNGLAMDAFEKNDRKLDDKEFIVVIVANLNREVKRVDLFVKACAIVHRQIPDVKFQVIGDGPLRKSLETLAKKIGLQSSIEFLGRRDDVPELLKKVSIGVISSDSEGLSNAIMEYMARGIPVVATNVGGNPELVLDGKTGLIVPPNDELAMAEAILKINQAPENVECMGMAGSKFIKDTFSIHTMIGKTDQIYRQNF
jgi:glycosyltransferase involved in cell wall biosynthesis